MYSMVLFYIDNSSWISHKFYIEAYIDLYLRSKKKLHPLSQKTVKGQVSEVSKNLHGLRSVMKQEQIQSILLWHILSKTAKGEWVTSRKACCFFLPFFFSFSESRDWLYLGPLKNPTWTMNPRCSQAYCSV